MPAKNETPHISSDNLVAVVGHAAFKTDYAPNELPVDPFEDDTPWVLAPFQKGEPHYYGEHLKEGVEQASEDPKNLLVVSGGFTRPDSVGGQHDWSEASSYLAAGERSGWYEIEDLETITYTTPSGQTIAIPLKKLWTPQRGEVTVALNEYARDSIENVLGDIASFMALTGELPRDISVLGWEFKRQRFLHHIGALGIAQHDFSYVGVNNPDPADLIMAEKGEAKALAAFQADPLGKEYEGKQDDPNYTGSLAAKRDERDPLSRGNPHWDMLTELRAKDAA